MAKSKNNLTNTNASKDKTYTWHSGRRVYVTTVDMQSGVLYVYRTIFEVHRRRT